MIFNLKATSTVKRVDRDDGEWTMVNGDEGVNEPLEQLISAASVNEAGIPSKLKATIKFGYEQGIKEALGTEDFDSWIVAAMTHCRTHYRHAESLGTVIEFEVCYIYPIIVSTSNMIFQF